jgi:hypothetical protein
MEKMMKKLSILLAATTLALSVFAQEAQQAASAAEPQRTDRRELSKMWPAPFAFCQWPRSADVIGLRLTLPFSTSQENITGLDVGFWGHSLYFEGIQLNAIRNDVVDSCAGIQIGLYNSIGRGDLAGIQIGLWNEALSIRGIQCGLVNVTGDAEGFQVGVINRAETMHGFQFGAINIIRDAELQFCPFVNIGF